MQGVLDMVKHLQNCKGKHVDFNANTQLRAWVNAQEIKQVFLNLVVNALESMGRRRRPHDRPLRWTRSPLNSPSALRLRMTRPTILESSSLQPPQPHGQGEFNGDLVHRGGRSLRTPPSSMLSEGVDDEVEKHLLDFLSVHPRSQLRVRVEVDVLALAVLQVLDHVEHPLHDFREIGFLARLFSAAAEGESQLLRDLFAAEGFFWIIFKYLAIVSRSVGAHA